MTFDELLRLVATEPPRTSVREVHLPAAELLRELRDAGFMRVSDFVADPRRTSTQRILREGHLLGPPLPVAEIERWQGAWPSHKLPTDLVALLQRANGIHLWADLGRGRSYTGIAPLAEWQLARTAMYGSQADPSSLSDRYLALSYHSDAAAFVALNVDSRRYFLMDSAGPDETSPVGRSVEDLLDWVWANRGTPRSE